PDRLPVDDSRGVRVLVARGIMEYSDVIQPLPCPWRKSGTTSSTLAVQITRVLPTSIRTEPSACDMKPGVIRTGRISPAVLPSFLIDSSFIFAPQCVTREAAHP